MRLFTNKRANFLDIPIYLLNSIVIATVIIFVTIILVNLNTNFQANNAIPNESKNGSNVVTTTFTSGGDYIVPSILLGFLMFSVISARLIPSSSKFAIIGVLVIFFMPFIAMIIGNYWDGFSTQATIATTMLNYPITKFLLDQMVIVTIFYSLIVGWALYAKDN